MRGALQKLPGVSSIAIEVGKREFDVTYDQAKVDVDDMLMALKEAKEPAKVR